MPTYTTSGRLRIEVAGVAFEIHAINRGGVRTEYWIAPNPEVKVFKSQTPPKRVQRPLLHA